VSIEITHVRFSGTQRTHKAIIRYKWRSIEDGSVGESDKPTLVDFIDNKGGEVFVGIRPLRVAVGAVTPSYGQPYLRTYADGAWTNNLVNLPTF